jgi:enoyl-CoA hydratase/isomerase-like protein
MTTTATGTTVTRTDADGVATVTLQTSGLSHGSRGELTDVLRAVAADDSVRAVVLTGAGRAVCVGQDLAEHVEALHADPATAMDVVAESYNPMALALAAVRVPVVVGVNGACVGAGLGLALAGDLRVAAAGAEFSTAFTGIGLPSDAGLAASLVHCLGVPRDRTAAPRAVQRRDRPALGPGAPGGRAGAGAVRGPGAGRPAGAGTDGRPPGGADRPGHRGDRPAGGHPGPRAAAAGRTRADRRPPVEAFLAERTPSSTGR